MSNVPRGEVFGGTGAMRPHVISSRAEKRFLRAYWNRDEEICFETGLVAVNQIDVAGGEQT